LELWNFGTFADCLRKPETPAEARDEHANGTIAEFPDEIVPSPRNLPHKFCFQNAIGYLEIECLNFCKCQPINMLWEMEIRSQYSGELSQPDGRKLFEANPP
jgi:hypothetical protein